MVQTQASSLGFGATLALRLLPFALVLGALASVDTAPSVQAAGIPVQLHVHVDASAVVANDGSDGVQQVAQATANAAADVSTPGPSALPSTPWVLP